MQTSSFGGCTGCVICCTCLVSTRPCPHTINPEWKVDCVWTWSRESLKISIKLFLKINILLVKCFPKTLCWLLFYVGMRSRKYDIMASVPFIRIWWRGWRKGLPTSSKCLKFKKDIYLLIRVLISNLVLTLCWSDSPMWAALHQYHYCANPMY